MGKREWVRKCGYESVGERSGRERERESMQEIVGEREVEREGGKE